MFTYEIRLGRGDSYIICRREEGKRFPMYLQRVYKGKFIWNHDYLWAKEFSSETTQKHIRTLTGSEC